MKILFLMGPMFPQSRTAHSLYLARKLIEFGHDVRCLGGAGPFSSEFARWGISFRTMPFAGLPGLEGMGLRRSARDMGADPPDIIHVQTRAEAAQGAMLARLTGIPYFLTNHSLFGRRERLRVDLPNLRGIVAGSQEIRERLVNRHKISRDLIKVISAGVDTGYFVPENDDGRPREDFLPVVGMVGRFERHKGGDLFIRAAKMVLDQGRECRFLIAGEGPENETWRQLAADLGISTEVTFASSTRDFRMLLQAIDIFIRPALREGTGIGLLEAMASGKPVIATGVGGIYNLVEENQTGFLVSGGDVAGLAVNMMKLVDDPDLARRMGRRGREVMVGRFDIESKVRDLAAFYAEQLDRAF